MEYEEFEKIILVLKDSFKRVDALSDVPRGVRSLGR